MKQSKNVTAKNVTDQSLDTTKLNAIQIEWAKEWLCELTWTNVDAEDIATMSDVIIERAIARHWDGGLVDFVASQGGAL